MGAHRGQLEGAAIFKECPNCEAKLVPGDISCQRCGFDLISGRRLGVAGGGAGGPSRLLVIVGLGIAGAVMIAVMLYVGSQDDPEVTIQEEHLCVQTLSVLRPLLMDYVGGSGEVPRCAATPPGPAGCWEAAGIPEASLPTGGSVSVELAPMASGFDLTCRADLDGDGESAVYKSTRDVETLLVTDPGVR